jgi:hypothetical protein
MKIYLIAYSNNVYISRKEYILNLKMFGFDDIFFFTKDWLETTLFYEENKNILDLQRGAGYWLWKPYIIIETFRKIEYGDIVFYMDVGDDINNPNIIKIIKNHMINNDYMIAGSPNRDVCKKYTKRDCFILMNCDEEKYHNMSIVEAGTLIFKKTDFNEIFINEWLHYCKNENIITDKINIYGNNYEGFIDHRHDQSVLSILTTKYNMMYNSELYSYIKYNSYNPKT